jgi:hypothetical protein
MRQVIPFITGALTLVAMWLAGSKRTAAWGVGLVNQFFWGLTIVVFGVWGLAPLTAALTVIYARNLVRWRGENIGRGSDDA